MPGVLVADDALGGFRATGGRDVHQLQRSRPRSGPSNTLARWIRHYCPPVQETMISGRTILSHAAESLLAKQPAGRQQFLGRNFERE